MRSLWWTTCRLTDTPYRFMSSKPFMPWSVTFKLYDCYEYYFVHPSTENSFEYFDCQKLVVERGLPPVGTKQMWYFAIPFTLT